MIVKLFLGFIALCVILYIAVDVYENLKQISSADTGKFRGIATPVKALVKGGDVVSTYNKKTGMKWQDENYLEIIYMVDGIEYTKYAGLKNTGLNLKAGDVVELMYDSMNPETAVFSDGSEQQSGKNGLKVDVAYALIAIIVYLIVFFVFMN